MKKMKIKIDSARDLVDVEKFLTERGLRYIVEDKDNKENLSSDKTGRNSK